MKLAERIRQRMIDDPPATGIRHIVIVRLIMADELPRQITGGGELCTCPWCANTRPAVWPCTCYPVPLSEMWWPFGRWVINPLCPHHGDAAYEARLPPWAEKLLGEDGEL